MMADGLVLTKIDPGPPEGNSVRVSGGDEDKSMKDECNGVHDNDSR